MLFIAALASSVVQSTPTVLPASSFFSRANRQHELEDLVKHLLRQPLAIMVSVEWSGDSSCDGMPRNFRSDRVSAHRQAMPRWESIPSK